MSLAAILGLGLWLFTELGWLRPQSQLAAQVTYEDQQAHAGNVATVLALQAPGDPTWREQLAAQVRLGLAAPLPAGDLLPAGTPPRLSRVDLLGGDLFSVTVTRDYVDSAGQTYAFDLLQRYRNLAPGQWERLPPDFTLLNSTTLFQGQRLSATVPTADLSWLMPALQQADDLLVQTCADWGDACQAGWHLPVTFGTASDLSDPTVTVRPSAVASSYPRVFDLPSASSRFPDGRDGYDLAAPLLAGRPHGAVAQAALSRSISVRVLSLFAGEVTGRGRANNDYFLDALVARAEVRHLGVSAVPQDLAPQDYIPLKLLWQVAGTRLGAGSWRTDLAWRREAFDFLNYALAGQPITVDGTLLRSLRLLGSAGVDDWLAEGLGTAAIKVTDDWTQQTVDTFARRPVVDWKQYDGLVMACDEAVFQVRGKDTRWVGSIPQGLPGSFRIGDVSPDGNYLALVYNTQKVPPVSGPNSGLSKWTELIVADLRAENENLVAGDPAAVIFGWSVTGELLYGVSGQANQTGVPAARLLMAYQPSSRTSYRIIPGWPDSFAFGPPAWSADHSALILGRVDYGPMGGPPTTSMAVLTFTPALQLRRLDEAADTAALSPDGQRVAYVKVAGLASTTADMGSSLDRLNVLDLTSGNISSLAAVNDPGLPTGIANFWEPRWSADGSHVAWYATSLPDQGADYLVRTSAGGGPLRLWSGNWVRGVHLYGFSPDDRYLAAITFPDGRTPDQFWLFDQQVPGVPPPLTGWANSFVWSSNGHRLVLAGPAGVSALDPATAQWEWLGPWQNCQLRWQ